jgi:tetratricopeptide (TPR) repeat protein
LRVDPELEYVFRNALVQEAAYDSLLKTDRRQLHRRVAESMEALYPDRVEQQAPLLAFHYTQAGDDEKALHYTLLAAQAAGRIFAYAESSGHYQHAIEILSRLPDTAENRLRRMNAILDYADQSWSTDSPVRRLAYLQAMEHILTEMPAGVRMRAQLALAATHMSLNSLPQALRYYRELLATAQAAGEVGFCMTAQAAISTILVTQGYFSAAEPLLVQSLAAAKDVPDRWEWGVANGYLGYVRVMRGRVADGLAQIQNALARAQATHHLTFIAMYHLQFTLAYSAIEDWQAVQEAGRSAATLSEFTGDRVYACLGYASQALGESRLGRHDDAVASMARADEIRARLGGRVYQEHLVALVETQVALGLGRLDDAISRAEAAVAIAHAIDAVFVEGYVQRLWAQALIQFSPPRWDEAEGHLAESLRLLENGGATLDVARTRAAWGRLCRDRGDTGAAASHFATAIDIFESANLPVLANQVRQMIG